MKKTKSERRFPYSLSNFQTSDSIENQYKLSSQACSISPEYSLKAIFTIESIISKKIAYRKRYIFQILKQFYLFSDSSMSSSCVSVGQYDPLLFSDQKIHTVFKILESQFIQRKIWGFINLRAHRIKQQLKQMVQSAENIIERVQYSNKSTSFSLIKQRSQFNQANQTDIAQNQHYFRSHQIGIVTNRASKLGNPEKSAKMDINLSSRTQESEREGYYIIGRRQQEGYLFCCCHGCCCCSSVSNHRSDLWSRIQYMKRLQELVRQMDQ